MTSLPLIVGLTGSIGMGKSTTAQMFRDAGVPVFDADAAVHTLYAKGGEAVPLIRAVFPDAVKDGAVDRKALGVHMRTDPLNLSVLGSFIHPMVGAMREAFLTEAAESGADIVVMDVPLLFETGGEAYCDYVVVVSAPADVQRERVMARDGMTEALFEHLLSRQTPDLIKRKKADFLILTDQGLDFARAEVQDILKQMRAKAND